MSRYEVPDPIINGPYDEPQHYWHIIEGEPLELREGRRPALYYYRPPTVGVSRDIRGRDSEAGIAIELKLVNLIRARVKEWREAGYPGASRTTLELLAWWGREGRAQQLFFAQREAAETIIFLNEARSDILQGIKVPRDEPGSNGAISAFTRYACKMATGTGKTTVMGMLAAWSILNKLNARSDARFSDVVYVICPNITIRNRLQELDPRRGEASLYRTRDLVPPHLMSLLGRGRVIVINWHNFEPREVNKVGSISSRVVKRGIPVVVETTRVIEGRRQTVKETHRIESDTTLVQRVLGREIGAKKNILVMNDEAHHAYRIRQEGPDAYEEDVYGEVEEAEEQVKEATVWIEGLDKIHKLRGINFCVDLSATPYYLSRVGQEANRPFPWVVSDFGLVDAIESGLVKIPQLAVRDSTGAEIPAYFNVWRWIMEPGRLTPSERGGSRADPKPEAILKWAQTPISQLGGLWEKTFEEWQKASEQHITPVFIIVCKNTKLARVLYEWLAEDKQPPGIAPSKLERFRNRNGQNNTIRVDTKVIHETDTEGSKDDEMRWMRFTLDTVGKSSWPFDSLGRPQYPPGFEELAEKLKRPLFPPGRDIRCIVSVGFLTEGWDCTTVTHIIGLRPFLSQLLCEQIVGRGLRRTNYALGSDGKFSEEIAQVYGVPFEIIPFKTNPQGAAPAPVKRHHVHALPEKEEFEIIYPRVEGYTTAIRNHVTVDWDSIPPMLLDPTQIPTEVEMKAGLPNNQGRHSLSGPGRVDDVTLQAWRTKVREQELEFDLATALTRDLLGAAHCDVPAHVLFPQTRAIVRRYLDSKVELSPGTDIKDVFLSPYYGWVMERLAQAIRGDADDGGAPEVPRFESNRGPGSTREVDFWTSREVREIHRSHLNYAVADTQKWEQSAAYYLDKHEAVLAFAKNAGLGFAIPYLHNGQMHDYVPDFLALLRWQSRQAGMLILETKGFDELAEIKRAAAERWVTAVSADGRYGQWMYRLVRQIKDVDPAIQSAAKALSQQTH